MNYEHRFADCLLFARDFSRCILALFLNPNFAIARFNRRDKMHKKVLLQNLPSAKPGGHKTCFMPDGLGLTLNRSLIWFSPAGGFYFAKSGLKFDVFSNLCYS